MKRRLFIYLFILAASCAACGKRSAPIYADADTLARSLYEKAGFETDSLFIQPVEDTDAYLFGVTITEFEDTVEDAVCFRKLIDSNGQMLYALKLRDEADAEALAASFFADYDFAPCDLAEKMAVVAAGNYVIFFKSESSEVDAAVEAFRSLMDGYIRFEKELLNRA